MHLATTSRHPGRVNTLSRAGAAVLVALVAASALAPPAHTYTRARGSAHAAPAGARVDNVASGGGRDALTATPMAVQSNLVRTVVPEWEALALDPGRAAFAFPGDRAEFVHRLENLGNVATDVRLAYGDGGGAFALEDWTLVRDDDADGTASAGDSAIASGGAIHLAAGAGVTLVVGARVPVTAPTGSAVLRLDAEGLAGASAATTDTVRTDATPPALAFYRDAGYAQTTRIAGTSRLYLQAIAPRCDRDPSRPDSVTLTIVSALTGDVETFVAVETSARSGRFRTAPTVALALASEARPPLRVAVPGVVDVLANDELVATLEGCGAARTEARAWVEPHGVVYDAAQDVPVAGARVTLIDVSGDGNGGNPNAPARVFAEDGTTPAPSSIVTGDDGGFRFPAVPASAYRLEVATPSGYAFPSRTPLAELPAGRVHDAVGSFGGTFFVTDAGSPVRFDAPVDPVDRAALRVEMSASREWVELGDSFEYAVRVTNTTTRTVTRVRVTATLPIGFARLAGTARTGAVAVAEATGAGGVPEFELGTLGATASVTLRFRVRAGAGAERGEAVATSRAGSPEAESNVARARVVVVDGVFADEASLAGTVYVDLDGDRRRSEGDPGLPGVKLVLDDGTFAITDVEGRYSFYGVPPRTHALRVDPASLPERARLVALDHRDAGTPGLRFVDLQRGDLQRADFALAADSTSRAAPEERRRLIARGAGELGRTVRRALPPTDEPRSPGDPRARPTSAIWNDQGKAPLVGPAEGDRARRPRPDAGARPHSGAEEPGHGGVVGAAPHATPGLDPALLDPVPAALLAAAEPEGDPGAGLPTAQPFGFLGLADGDTLPSDQVTVRVAGRAAFTLELRVNGDVVPLARVGRRSIRADVGLQIWDYVGVRLRPGVNALELIEVAPDSLPGARAAIRLVAPDRLGALELAVVAEAIADGASDAVLRVRALDARGVPAPGRVVVTLESDRGVWRHDDVDPRVPGLQVVLDGGAGELRLGAPAEPGRALVRATAGPARTEAAVEFAPALRSLFAVGAAEWQLGWNYQRRGFATPRRARTGFEQEFTSLVVETGGKALLGGARAAVFAKGRLGRDVLLTLGYDSDRPADLRRFRDVQPDAFYPLYGDASVRGYEAQSTGRLYARLDRRGASLLYGDFVAGHTSGARSLASYSRSLTGVQHRLETARLRLDAFASRGQAPLRVDELPGRGISGPYFLARTPIAENSERVEILVRDRQLPGRIVSVTAKTRFLDYDLDPLDGRLLFKQPVPSFDADLNPVSIRVTYEVLEGGAPFWVGGVEGRVQVGPRVELGGSVVEDRDPERPARLGSVFAAARLGAATQVEGEVASAAGAGREGRGVRVEARHDNGASQGRLWATATSHGFANPHAGWTPGRTEAGVRWSSRWNERTRLLSEGALAEERASGVRRAGLLLGLDRGLARGARAELGVRFADEQRDEGPDPRASFALRGKLTAQWPRRPELSGYAELEQDVVDPARRLAALGGEYRFSAQARLYARHELSSSLVGPMALEDSQRRLASVLGVDADVARSAHVFSEYRLADALAGREAEAALGIRNAWRLRDGFRIGASFERVSPLGREANGPTTAATASIESLEDPDAKMSARLEMRTSRASDAALGTMAAAFRVDAAWSLIGRSVASVTDDHGRGVTVRERFQAGLAYRRPDREAWDALGRYELKLDRAPDETGERQRRLAHVISFHTTGKLYELIETSIAWAGKRVTERTGGLATRTAAQWLHGRASRGFGRVWDAGVHASVLTGSGARRDGLGVEMGRRVGPGVWLSAGWNRLGYDDADLPEESYHRSGVYVRVRARFDESIVGAIPGAGGGR